MLTFVKEMSRLVRENVVRQMAEKGKTLTVKELDDAVDAEMGQVASFVYEVFRNNGKR